MNEDRANERSAVSSSWCEKCQLRYPHRIDMTGCPLCNREKQAQRTPPTPRPDVEGIRQAAQSPPRLMFESEPITSLCDYALDTEQRLALALDDLETANAVMGRLGKYYDNREKHCLAVEKERDALKAKLKAAEETLAVEKRQSGYKDTHYNILRNEHKTIKSEWLRFKGRNATLNSLLSNLVEAVEEIKKITPDWDSVVFLRGWEAQLAIDNALTAVKQHFKEGEK